MIFVVGGAGARKTLLVIGKDIGFSDLLSEYALDMAERNGVFHTSGQH